MKRVTLTSLILILIFSMLVACSAPTAPAEPEKPAEPAAPAKESPAAPAAEPAKPAEEKPAEEQVLNLLMRDITTLDTNDATTSAAFVILAGVHDGLARAFVDPETGLDVITPAHAESWEESEDHLTYTFHLRPNKWSDGVPVIAQHYVDSIRLLNPENGFSYAFIAYDIKNAEAYYNKTEGITAEDLGVQAPDDNTLVITLEKVNPAFIKKIPFVSLFPIRLDLIEKGGENFATDLQYQAFSGPFKITKWVKQSSVTLEKNPEYWDAENIKLDRVEMKIVEEQSTQAQLFESKQLDMVSATGDYMVKWQAQADKGEFQSVIRNIPNTQFLLFNMISGGPSGLMQNVNIRKALSLAINRPEFAELVYGRNKPAYGLYPPALPIGDLEIRAEIPEPLKEEAERLVDDKEALQALFKEGLRELGKSEDLSQVELLYIATGTSALDKAKLEYIQQSWESKLGIRVKFNVLPDGKTLRAERLAGKYDVQWNSWTGDYGDPMTFADLFITTSGFHVSFGGYTSEKYDATFAQLEGETDDAKRLALFAELEKILVAEDFGCIPYMYLEGRNFMHNYVKNLQFPLFGTEFEFTRVYLEGK